MFQPLLLVLTGNHEMKTDFVFVYCLFLPNCLLDDMLGWFKRCWAVMASWNLGFIVCSSVKDKLYCQDQLHQIFKSKLH